MTERLTEAEREALVVELIAPDDSCAHNFVPLFAAVESIIAARETALRESIAQEIEALPGPNGEGLARWDIPAQNGYLLGIEEAAARARGGNR